MAVDAARAKSLFLAASDLADPAERAAYLERECGGDAELRGRVEALLRANDAAPLPPAGPDDATSAHAPDRQPQTEDYGDPTARVGAVLAGKYKLVEEIGEGGMGSVYMAQQTEPVKRAVAVKVIKAGMDSKAVLARFEAERQALALMDHPNIAKVLDAGTTDGGRPFFVMELVKGVPITQYCDERKLTPRQRLELFVPVCQAIQHAHQKGIIHRDIKPSNVLVALYDDRPVPKVIDFGVAKAAGQTLTDKTLMTGFGAVVGTPEYMSPEQASLNNLDIDTRSDVYSLGVLLYELLTGQHAGGPQEPGQGGAAGNPADRPRGRGPAAERQAEHHRRPAERRRQPRHRAGQAVEADEGRTGLGGDEGAGEGPHPAVRDGQRPGPRRPAVPGRRGGRGPAAEYGYRLKKFVRRHKGQVIAASLVLLALLAGIAGTTSGLLRAEQRRVEADAARADETAQREQAQAAEATSRDVLKFIEEHVFAAARPEGRAGGLGKDVTLRQAIDAAEPAIATAFADRPLVELQIRSVLAKTYEALSEWGRAVEQWEKWLTVCDRKLDRRHPDYYLAIEGMIDLETQDRWAELLKLVEDAYHHFRKVAGPNDPNRLHLQRLYAGLIESEPGRAAEARQLEEEALAHLSRDLAPDHPYRLQLERYSASAMLRAGRKAEGLALMENNLHRVRDRFPQESVEVIDALYDAGGMYLELGRHAEAANVLEEGFRRLVARFGSNHLTIDRWLRQLSEALVGAGRPADSAKLLEEYLVGFRKRLGPDHHDTVALVINLTVAYLDLKRYDEIPPLIHEVLNDKVRNTDLNAFGLLKGNLGRALFALNRPGAVTEFVEIVEVFWQQRGPIDGMLFKIVRGCCEYLENAGRNQDRVKLLEAIVGRVRELGAKNPNSDASAATAEWETTLANAYIDIGKFDLALPLHEEIFNRQKLRFGADHLDTLVLRSNQAVAYRLANRLDLSIPLLEETLKRMEATLGRDHRNTLTSVGNLGVAYKEAGRLAEAIPLLEEAYRSRQKYSNLGRYGQRLLDAYAKAGENAKFADLLREQLVEVRKVPPQDGENLADLLTPVGRTLLDQKSWPEAEPLLREALAVREKEQPGSWKTFSAKSLLGEALLGQKQYTEAEPLLLAGYAGMKQREKTIPPLWHNLIPEALDRLIELYNDTDKPDEVKKWQAERAKYPQAKKPVAPEKK